MEKKSFSVGDMFQFDRMIAPTVLKIIYWIGLVGIVVYILVALAGSLGMMAYSPVGGLGMLLLAILGGLFGLLFWRVMIEVYMVLFGIFERLGDVRDHLVGPKDDETLG